MTSTTPGDDESAREFPADTAENVDAASVEADAPAAEVADTAAAADASDTAAAETAAADTAAPADDPAPAAFDSVDASSAEPTAGDAVPEASDENPTAKLDAALERAAAVGDDDDVDVSDADTTPAPVPADAVRRETYVPASTAAVGAAAGAATLAPEPPFTPPAPPIASDVAAPAPQAIYVQAPQAPKAKGNRGFGVLVALIGTVLFAALYLGASYLLLLTQGTAEEAAQSVVTFLPTPAFWVPVVIFFLGFALLAAIINRGPWWAYAVFGLLVGIAVYLSYVGGALWTVAWDITPADVPGFVAERWLDPLAIVAGVIAREIPIWLGGWIASRGRAVTERNRAAYEAYEREIAAGPQVR